MATDKTPEQLALELKLLQEKLALYEGPQKPATEEDEKKRAAELFKIFDTDNSGDIDAKEFQDLAFHLGETLTLDEVRTSIKSIDTDNSGTVNFEEFYSWWTSNDHKSLTDSRTLQDLDKMKTLRTKLKSRAYMRTVTNLLERLNKNRKAVQPALEGSNARVVASVRVADLAPSEVQCGAHVEFVKDDAGVQEIRNRYSAAKKEVLWSFYATIKDDADDLLVGEFSGSLKTILEMARKPLRYNNFNTEVGRNPAGAKYFALHVTWDPDTSDPFIGQLVQAIAAFNVKTALVELDLSQNPRSAPSPDEVLKASLHTVAEADKVAIIDFLKGLGGRLNKGEEFLLGILERFGQLDLDLQFEDLETVFDEAFAAGKKLAKPGAIDEDDSDSDSDDDSKKDKKKQKYEYPLSWKSLKEAMAFDVAEILKKAKNNETAAPVVEAFFKAGEVLDALDLVRVVAGDDMMVQAKFNSLFVLDLFPNRQDVEGGATSQSDGPKWIGAIDGAVPENSFVGGQSADGETFYVGRASHKGGVHPGRVSPKARGCVIAYGGEEIVKSIYEILVADEDQLEWKPCQGRPKKIKRPVEGSYEGDGQPLYIARATIGGGVYIGKAGTHLSRGMSVAYEGKEIDKAVFDVLVYAKKD